jgi:hypothetical protein
VLVPSMRRSPLAIRNASWLSVLALFAMPAGSLAQAAVSNGPTPLTLEQTLATANANYSRHRRLNSELRKVADGAVRQHRTNSIDRKTRLPGSRTNLQCCPQRRSDCCGKSNEQAPVLVLVLAKQLERH